MRRRSRNPTRELVERDTIVGLGKLVVPDYAKRLHWFHREIAEALEGMLRFTHFRGKRGGYARVRITMPARHGKTLHGSELLPALGLGRYPDLKIIGATATAELAKQGIRNTRNYMQSPAYKERYATRVGRVEEVIGEQESGKVETENSALVFRTLKREGKRYVHGNGYYLAAGIGGSFIGKGADIIIMDDWVRNAKQALNPKYVSSLWDFYLSTLSQRGDHPWTSQLYIGHCWTTPDFTDELMEYWRSESSDDLPMPIKEIKLSAIAEEPIPDYDPREPGEGLDHEWFRPRAWYENKRASIMSKRPWVWHGMWQQRPSLDGAKFFQPGDWRYYGKSFQLASRLDVVDFSIDAAMSGTGQSFTVINVYGYVEAAQRAKKDAGEQFFWLDEARGHWTIEQLYAQFEYLWRKWSRALPRQFDTLSVIEALPDIYTKTLVSDDDSKHHARARVWVEDKALGHSFLSRYASGVSVPGVTTTLTAEEQLAVSEALYPVPKIHSKIYCGSTAGQVTAQGRVWLPQESFGEDPLDASKMLVDASPIGVQWERDEHGALYKVKGPPADGSWVHEQGNYPSTPDDRRDVLAQAIICRVPWMGPLMLGSR